MRGEREVEEVREERVGEGDKHHDGLYMYSVRMVCAQQRNMQYQP